MNYIVHGSKIPLKCNNLHLLWDKNLTKDNVKKMLKFLKLKDLLLNYVIMTSKTSGRT